MQKDHNADMFSLDVKFEKKNDKNNSKALLNKL